MHRALADLPRPVDVERANGDRREVELLPVVVGEMLRGELADRIGPTGLADRSKTGDVGFPNAKRVRAEDLARREVDHTLDACTVIGRAKNVHRTLERDLHRRHGVLQDRIDAGDRCHVDHVLAPRDRSANRRHVANIADDELDVRMVIEARLRERVPAQDIEDPDVVIFSETRGQRRPDEPRAPGNQDVRPLQHDPQLAQTELGSRESSVPLQGALRMGS